MSQRKLKILLLDEGLNTGNPEASKIGGGQLSRWCLFTQKDYFSVTVLTSEPEIAALWRKSADVVLNTQMQCYRPLRSEISFTLYNVYRILKESIRAAKILSYEIQKLEYDIIFLNDNKSRLLYIVSNILGITKFTKVVKAIEMDTEWFFNPYDEIIKTIYMIFFNKILCPSEAAKTKLGLIGRLFKHKLQVAYPLVDSPKSSLRKTKSIKKNNRLVFANIGTVRFKIKGQDVIVQAIEMLAKDKKDLPIEVRFYGDGPDLRKLQEMIKEKKLKRYLKVMGYEKNQEVIYNGIDVCIIASRTETASLVLLECLHRNIPVIVSNIAPLLEIKQLFYTGLSFRSGDAEDLAAVILNLLNSNLLTTIHEIIAKNSKDRIALHNQVKVIYDFLTRLNSNKTKSFDPKVLIWPGYEKS